LYMSEEVTRESQLRLPVTCDRPVHRLQPANGDHGGLKRDLLNKPDDVVEGCPSNAEIVFCRPYQDLVCPLPPVAANPDWRRRGQELASYGGRLLRQDDRGRRVSGDVNP